MKKLFMAMAIIASCSFAANAQKGTKQVSGGIELALPTGTAGDAFRAGAGINLKGMYGISEMGEITATTGFTSLKQKGSGKDYKAKLGVIPVLAGYRHHFDGFYAEPQLGMGIYASKIKADGFKESDSQVNFTWALGGGYVYKNYDFSLRYQSGEASGGSFGMFALKVAYNFNLSK